VLTQGQYIFIHDIIKRKLQSLGYGLESPADDATEDEEDLYQSKALCQVSAPLPLPLGKAFYISCRHFVELDLSAQLMIVCT